MKLPLILVVATSCLFFGCRPKDMPPTTQPLSSAMREFASVEHGVRFGYPAGWSSTPTDAYVLQIVSGSSSISLDVPKLPVHVPGFIPLGMVVNGYVDDLKKKAPAVKVEAPVALKVAGANAKRVKSSVEDAVLTVHGDRVYIFRATPDASDVLDDLLRSVQWK